MPEAIFNKAYKALYIDEPQNQPPVPKKGILTSHKAVPLIVIGSASALVITAGIVSAVFFSYIAAALCAAALLTLAVGTVVLYRSDPSASFRDLIEKLIAKVETLFKEIKQLKKQAQAEKEGREAIKKENEKLKKDFENKEIAHPQKKNDKLPNQNAEIGSLQEKHLVQKPIEKEVPIKQINQTDANFENDKNLMIDIPKRDFQPIEEEPKDNFRDAILYRVDHFMGNVEDVLGDKDKEINDLKKELAKFNPHEVQELKNQLEDKIAENKRFKEICKNESKQIMAAVHKARENWKAEINKSIEDIKGKMKDKKKKAQFEDLVKPIRDALPNVLEAQDCVKQSPDIAELVANPLLTLLDEQLKHKDKGGEWVSHQTFLDLKKEFNQIIGNKPYDGNAAIKLIYDLNKMLNLDDIENAKSFENIDEKLSKKIKGVLGEIYKTEDSFARTLDMLRPYFDLLKLKNLLTEDEYKEMTRWWGVLIKETISLVKKLEILDSNSLIFEKIKAYEEAFFPKNIEKYFYALEMVIGLRIHEKFIKINQKEGKQLENKFGDLNVDKKTPSDISIEPVQRIQRHPFLGKELLELIGPLDERLKKSMGDNLNYIKNRTAEVNALKPPLK